MREKVSKYAGKEIEYLTKVLNSESWSSTEGSWANTLEREFALNFGSKYAVAMNSGTSVLHAALVACGVRPGDEVITPALTVFMDTSSILHCSAIPVYADVEPRTFNIDHNDVIKKITDKTKAIIAVSLYGLECNVEALMKIANEYDLYLILDNAQHLGMHKGHVTTYSFESSKHLSCGEGGIALTNNEDIAVRMRKLSNHGFKNSTADEGRTKLNIDDFQTPWYKRHSVIGWNYRLSEFCSAVALAQMERVEELLNNRLRMADNFKSIIEETKCKYLIPQKGDLNHTYWTYVVKYQGRFPWQSFRRQYMQNGGDGIYGCWSVPYFEPAMQSRTFVRLNPEIYANLKYEAGLCPVAEAIQPTIMQFKTNYTEPVIATAKAEALRKTIEFMRMWND